MVDKLKFLVALLLVAAGITAFYVLENNALILRILVVLLGLIAAGAVWWTTPVGKQAFAFVKESVAEAKKVVWPTRKETMQTTMVVFILVVVMAIILAFIDIGFAYMVQWLTGRGA